MGAGPGWPVEPRPGQVLLCACLAATACFFSATAVNVLAPSIARDLRASSAQAQWVVLAYWLSLSVLTLCFGRVADMHGKRRLFCAGLAVFGLAAFAAAMASGATVLLVLRGIQGAAAAAIFANTAVLVADAYRGPALGFALGRLAMVAALAQALGPALGGWLDQVLGWRSVFACSGMLALAVLVHALRVVAQDLRPRQPPRFDWVGALLSATGLGMLCWGLAHAGTPAAGSGEGLGQAGAALWPAGLMLVASVGSFALLWRWLCKAQAPLIAPDLLRDPRRLRLCACVFLMAIAQQGPIVILALYYQLALQWPASDVGWRLAALALGMVLGAPVAGWATRHVAAHTLCTGALASLAVFTLSLGGVVLFDGGAWLPLCMAGLGASLALFVTPCNQVLMDGCPAAHRGIVNALRASLQSAGGLTGIALVALLTHAWVAPDLLAQLYAVPGQPVGPAARAAMAQGVAIALACVAAMVACAAWLSGRRGGLAPQRPAGHSA
ncbi:MFS transporter [Acidovorax sp.]|uniref:MFS transporter n=1 Tax=Acidovorax sp. TaxID=1872122 RepID=UPI002ACEB8ED|nr:MFS transporter [Acidovorax sp.]MDZ7862991.1 MFS transporter [Acidovorax sp.]